MVKDDAAPHTGSTPWQRGAVVSYRGMPAATCLGYWSGVQNAGQAGCETLRSYDGLQPCGVLRHVCVTGRQKI